MTAEHPWMLRPLRGRPHVCNICKFVSCSVRSEHNFYRYFDRSLQERTKSSSVASRKNVFGTKCLWPASEKSSGQTTWLFFFQGDPEMSAEFGMRWEKSIEICGCLNFFFGLSETKAVAKMCVCFLPRLLMTSNTVLSVLLMKYECLKGNNPFYNA